MHQIGSIEMMNSSAKPLETWLSKSTHNCEKDELLLFIVIDIHCPIF